MAALIDYIQVIGDPVGTVADIETATLAMRQTPKPEYFGGLGGGVYSTTALVAVGTTLAFANAVLYAFRWPGKQSIARVRKVSLSLGSIAAGTAGVFTFQVFRARNFTSQYSTIPNYDTVPGGVANLPMTALRSTMSRPTSVGMTTTGYYSAPSAQTALGNPLLEVVYFSLQSDSGTITPGLTGAVVNLDTNPIAAITTSRVATAGRGPLPSFDIWNITEGDQPLDLSSEEGFVLTMTAPASGGSQGDGNKLAVTTTFSEIPLSAL